MEAERKIEKIQRKDYDVDYEEEVRIRKYQEGVKSERLELKKNLEGTKIYRKRKGGD